MNTSFRRQLAHRLLQIAALAAPAAAPVLVGCGHDVSSSGCGNVPTFATVQVCFDPQQVDAGDLGGQDAGPIVNGCPTDVGAQADIQAQSPSVLPSGADTFSIESGPVNMGSQCCYVIQPHVLCIGGRPFLVDDRPLQAPPVAGASGWSDTDPPLPAASDLPAALRAELAEAWTRDALTEHAAIASFARFSLELLAAGAPADLVDLAHRAAADEVRHARLCFSLAGAYAGAPVGPGAFPFAGSVEVTSDLASIAARVAVEGCVGETISAVQAAEQLARAADPAVKASLSIIAADEARHAELAWRTVVWAMSAGGAPVRAAVVAVLENLDGGDDGAPCVVGRLDAHGRLDAEEQRRVTARAIAEVVRPAARALLGAPRAVAARDLAEVSPA